MKLQKARVLNYKSITDSGWVSIDDVTCMVGKNESGKTAFLQALERLNPVSGSSKKFDPVYDYPTSKYSAYKKKHAEDPDVVVKTQWQLEEHDIDYLEGIFGENCLESTVISISKKYDNSTTWNVDVNETAIVSHLANSVIAPSEALSSALQAAQDGPGLVDAIKAHGTDNASAQELKEQIASWSESSIWQGVVSEIKPIPSFFYFDDYNIMQGKISLNDLARRVEENGTIQEQEKPFIALLELIGSTPQELRDETNNESLIRELESASVSITDEMFEFWRQNEGLELRFVRDDGDPNEPAPLNQGKVLSVRVYNARHRTTVPFDQRSKGFIWFFSFLVFFQQLKNSDQETILLLDEPALSLHALAQEDFLRFIDERLKPEHQVIYSTHSPFMVDPAKLSQVRTVEDKKEEGTVVSAEIFRSSKETIFPLQAALGYDLAQTLFIAPNNLLVEGPSDLIYLPFLSEAVKRKGHQGLDDRWVIIPVGGIDKIATFLSLLGANQLNVSVLIDVSRKDHQRVQNLVKNDYLKESHLIKIGSVLDSQEADIEDIFAPEFYCKLVNGAYAHKLGRKKVSTKNLQSDQTSRIAKQVERYFDENAIGSFNHFPPSQFLLHDKDAMSSELDDSTIERAVKLFEKINSTLRS